MKIMKMAFSLRLLKHWSSKIRVYAQIDALISRLVKWHSWVKSEPKLRTSKSEKFLKSTRAWTTRDKIDPVHHLGHNFAKLGRKPQTSQNLFSNAKFVESTAQRI